VRGGPECLGHRPTFPHGHILLHPQCGSHRRSAIGGGVHRPAGVEEGDGRGLPAERAQLLDCRAPLPRHALCLRPTVLDEQQKHIQGVNSESSILRERAGFRRPHTTKH